MTTATFRRLALSLPEAIEREHMDHPDFRVGGKIFATLGYPGEEFGMVKLTPDEQQAFMQQEPGVFTPCNGAWGRRGATHVRLARAKEKTVRPALKAAWLNVAPKRLSKPASL